MDKTTTTPSVIGKGNEESPADYTRPSGDEHNAVLVHSRPSNR
jgi:hypothetical protein